MTPSFVIPAAGNGSPDSVNRRRRMAEAMLAQSMGAEPISSPWQGAAKLAQALMGGLATARADSTEKKGREAANQALIRALTGGQTVHQGDDPTGAMVEGINNPWQSDAGTQMLMRRWEQQNTPYKPDYKTIESNGDTLRYDANDPNSKPELFYDGPNPDAKPNPTRDFVRGNQRVTEEFDPKSGTWRELAVGDAFKTSPDVMIREGGTAKQIYDTTEKRAEAAKAARSGLYALDEAQRALPGAITGAMANERLALQKLGAMFGVSDPQAIQDTETFRSAIAPQVGAMIKSITGSAQVSDSDRKFAEKAAAGDITLDAGSIARLLDIQKQVQTGIIREYNRDLGNIYPEGQGFDQERAALNVPQVPRYGASQNMQRPQGPEVSAMPPPAATSPVQSPTLGAVGSNQQGKGDIGGAKEVWTIDAQGNPVRVR